jgi:hypothetical protein
MSVNSGIGLNDTHDPRYRAGPLGAAGYAVVAGSENCCGATNLASYIQLGLSRLSQQIAVFGKKLTPGEE